MNLSKHALQEFQKKGYIILKEFWTDQEITEWENAVYDFYSMQCEKILGVKPRTIDDALTFFETEDKTAGYQVLQMLERSVESKKLLTNTKIIKICCQLLKCSPNELILEGAHPFINLPKSKRLLYKWHSEANYYPKRQSFLNIWMPIFRNKSVNNGTMWFCEQSHQIKERQFIEYQGYDKETFGKPQHFIQYEIPTTELTKYKKIPVTASRKDLVIFHRSLVHTSTQNKSTLPSYATVFRCYNFTNDLTLSGNPATTPYTRNDYARPDMTTRRQT